MNMKKDEVLRKSKILEAFKRDMEKDNSCVGEDAECKSWEELIFYGSFKEKKIDEANLVTFNNKAYPKYGWAVIVSGGAGSGKGFVISKLVQIDAKIIDVDLLKKLYSIKHGYEWDLKNPDNVAKLINAIEHKDWNANIVNQFFSSNNKLKNIILDISGKSLTSVQNYLTMASDLGYSTSLIWVVTNREVAMIRNLQRDKIVPQQHFHQIHNQVSDTMFNFLKDPWFSKRVDEAWVVFSGPATAEIEKHANATVREEVLKDKGFNLIKKDNAFTTFTTIKGKLVDLNTKIIDWLGPQETDYNDPVVYKRFDQAKKELAALKREPSGAIKLGQKLDLKQFSTW